ncbi:MAG: hypothetical protein CGU29_06965 [Candidatus Dactylopiibacterium carminicum]|uniref:DUF2863 domain-containing protein n=1 Tax=Candidatus Dactylopiibacterium carminicum TaxID=857335 RepID=A0A272EVH8_9RHOO|nr:DUF2863 family protein [Candidatus Dactylopiibacterium carminicum]KAF7599734.1 DUF2863 domain-containing protein [Candidatus Dactylopiibacterium carminicum]PAS93670.1 MAG: hypothetical protein CGU29_06965 [Candidatus Dactylopiibacterium carminicum]PAS99736.1 MAG: hypothetical protein BSR46_06560 [Candidatus Dactylopiibacterium carminicum]
MKRNRFGRRSSLPREAEELLRLASGLADSGSRAEDSYWEASLFGAIIDQLQGAGEEVLNATLDQAYIANPRAYDVLADCIETCAEQNDVAEGQLLLIAAPLLAWSRFSIPATPIPTKVLQNLRVHLQAHVLARNVKLALADVLFSPDQLPQGYCDTASFTASLADAARNGATAAIDPSALPETNRFLSDVRYLLGAVIVLPGEPVFRWQEADGSREQALSQWRSQGGACLQPLLPGCATELVLPDAYFAACREADRASRPYSIQASVAFLSTTLDVSPAELRAVIAPFHEQQLEEFRIGFTHGDGGQVVHGVVWPLLGQEDDPAEVLAQIGSMLKECGMTRIQQLDQRFPLEYCDDCSVPLYPSPEGEAVHAELPEAQAEQVPRHLH